MCAMVGALVPDREMADLVAAVARSSGEEVPCIETSPEGLVGALRMLEPHGVKIILSSGRLVDLLKTATTLPVVACNPSSFDLLLALNRAKALSSKIALLHFGGLPLNIREIEDALSVRIGEFVSGRSTQDVRATVEQIKVAGFAVVVSGQAPAGIARGYGLNTVVIRAGSVTVLEALQAATSTLKNQESSEVRSLAAQSAAESAGFGVLVLDKTGRVQFMNPLAREITGAANADHVNEILGKGAWERLNTNAAVATAVFGENRLIAECRRNPRLEDSRIITIMDPPLLRRLLASVSDEAVEAAPAGSFSDLVAPSLTMGSVMARALDLARNDDGAIIYGEPGSGKHSIAQAIHSASRRARAPFVRLNAMLPDESVLADLTGAGGNPDEPTLLERAHGGTIYIHECWNLGQSAQRVFLEALERKSVRRSDGTRVPCDVRVLLGSTRPLRDVADSGKMIPEFYERSASEVLRLPALRDRQEDIMPMLAEFLKREGLQDPTVSQSLQRRLLAHRWTGNCTELRNFASRLASLYRAFPSASRPTIEKTAFDELESEARPEVPQDTEVLVLKPGTMEFLEEQILEQMDKIVGGNKSELARRLGISRTTLWKKQKPELTQAETE